MECGGGKGGYGGLVTKVRLELGGVRQRSMVAWI